MKKDEKSTEKKPDRTAELQTQLQEMTETTKRLAAEFDNYRKRIEKSGEEVRQQAAQRVIGKLLSVLDSFEQALKNTNDAKKFIEGMHLLHAQFMDTLRSEGLEPIAAVGKKFDPYEHEALLMEVSEQPEGTVLEELQKGYKLNSAVLRHAKVKVAKHDQQESPKKEH